MFLMELSTEDMIRFFSEKPLEEVQYALRLLVLKENELVAESFDEVYDVSEAQEYLKRFTIKGK